MLREFARMSQIVGERNDYVQGGGGNTSVKLGNGLMAIKASGFRLNQVTETDGFAVVEVDTLNDVTVGQGYKPLRPSVEVGFHALLGKFVLHTHPVYANLALCSRNGVDRLPALMEGRYNYIVVPYINPGEELSAAIGKLLRPDTQVVFMVNHGIIVTADNAEECLQIHDDVNELVAKSYGVTRDDYDRFSQKIGLTLYPDQQVYLTLTEVQSEIMSAVMFIQFTLMQNSEEIQAMDEKAMDFIGNWESEAYRKTILN
ncbi:MAG: class II aldolase/adducin family protein [Oscillospiraceae bacterium]|nr:class II aldolase/adducin family protein [Oscillospiraceae bacterium]